MLHSRPHGGAGRAGGRRLPGVDRPQPGPGHHGRGRSSHQPPERPAPFPDGPRPRPAALGRPGLPDLPKHRAPDPRPAGLGGVHRGRGLREGRALHSRAGTRQGRWRARSTSSGAGRGPWRTSAGSSRTSPTLTGDLQGAATLVEFGERLLSGLVPALGGGVAGFYALEPGETRLRRVADYGLAESAMTQEWIALGEGLAGQCARERKPVQLAGLPPDYLRISSGLGGAAPTQAEAWPLASREALLAVVEVASFRALGARERALLEELLPAAALNLEVLQRNLRTQELLVQTRDQAEELEAQQVSLQRTQVELRETEQFFRSVLELAPDGLMVTDEKGVIKLANAKCEELFGYPRVELVGQPVEMLVPEDVRPRHSALREGFPPRRRPTRAMGPGSELLALRKDGSLFPGGDRAQPAAGAARRGRAGRRVRPRRHRAQACRAGAAPRELPLRQRPGPDQGRLLARAARRLRLVQLLRAGDADLRRPAQPRPPLPHRRLGRARPRRRRGRGPAHDGELRRRGGRRDPRLRLHLRLQAAGGRARRLDPRARARGEGRQRQADRHVRRHPGHHRLQAAGGRAGRRPAEGRGSHPDEVDVPRQHEPRDPHAHERDHRPVAPGPEDRAHRRSSATTWARSTTRGPRS